jgi:hypothetical protein
VPLSASVDSGRRSSDEVLDVHRRGDAVSHRPQPGGWTPRRMDLPMQGDDNDAWLTEFVKEQTLKPEPISASKRCTIEARISSGICVPSLSSEASLSRRGGTILRYLKKATVVSSLEFVICP